MLVVRAQRISMAYGQRMLFDIDDLTINTGDRIALVGRNGSGKSTLLKILAGYLDPLSGSVVSHGAIAYVPQLEEGDAESLLDAQREFWGIPLEAKSGGEMTRLKVARALGRESSLLILDEPTSNLDYNGIVKLENELANYKGALLLVSHDRELLNNLCNKVWEIEDGKLNLYKGNWDSYFSEKELEKRRHAQKYEKYIETKAHLEDALRDRAGKASSMKLPTRMDNSEARLHRGSIRQRQGNASAVAAGIRRRIESLEAVESPRKERKINMQSEISNDFTARYAVEIKGLFYSYGDHVVLEDAELNVPTGKKAAISGGNGSGKSTLLKAIYNRLEGIKLAPGADIGYFAQDLSMLDDEKTVLDNVMDDSRLDESNARTVLARLLIRRDDVFKKCGVLSGGERSKATLAKLICSRNNLLLLDEPTNYLDVYALQALEEMVRDFPGTVLFVSHDRAFQKNCAEVIYDLENKRVVLRQQAVKKNTGAARDKLALGFRRDLLMSQIHNPPSGKSTEDVLTEITEVERQLKEIDEK